LLVPCGPALGPLTTLGMAEVAGGGLCRHGWL